MRLKYIFPILIILFATLGLQSCIEDDISTSASDQPTFSLDTLKMGRVFTAAGTPTYSFRVYNRHNKVMSIERIGFKDGGSGMFRLNVDGQSGSEFRAIEIRPNDSIYVFVSALLAENGKDMPIDIFEKIEFENNGRKHTIVVTAEGQDVDRFTDFVIESDTHWTGNRARQIFGKLKVAEGARLTLDAGCKLYFHDGAHLEVEGTLECNGTPEAPVEMTGDRFGQVVGRVAYELMSKQWNGVYFAPKSRSNRLTHTSIRNTWYGVVVDSLYNSPAPALELVNCQLRNSAGCVLEAYHTSVSAVGCEFAEGAAGLVYLQGGSNDFNHCTFANNYLFAVISGPAIGLWHINEATDDESGLPMMSAEFTNSVIYGLGNDISHGNLDDTQVYFRRCLMRGSGEDDEHFVNMMWAEDPLFYTVRKQYLFDYRPKAESPIIGAADAAFDSNLPQVDFLGVQRRSPATLGAYEPKE